MTMSRGNAIWLMLLFAVPSLGSAACERVTLRESLYLSPEAEEHRYAIFNETCTHSESPLVDGDDASLVGRFVAPRYTVSSAKAAKALPYPQDLRRRGITGKVELAYILEEYGAISFVAVVKSSGNEELDETAMEFLKGTSFATPALLDGKPVRAFLSYEARFSLTPQ
jgi:TonB family protein